MVANFDSVQQIGKEQFEAASASAAAVTKGWQSIAAETTDFSKKSYEKSRALAEKLLAVKKLKKRCTFKLNMPRALMKILSLAPANLASSAQ